MTSSWRGERSLERQWSKHVVWLTCGILVLPVLVDLARDLKYRPFGYAAGDTFYYLGVARTAVEHGSLSLDGLHASNGFHPLWQLASVLIYAICHLLGSAHAALPSSVLVSLACVAGAVWLLGESFRRATGGIPAAFVLLPVGVYALIASYYWHVGPPNAGGGLEGPLPVYGTLYSFANGMESGLVLLSFGWLCFTLLRYEGESSYAAGLRCGGACAVLCLARLDHAAFVLTPLALWLAELLHDRRRYRFLVAALSGTLLPIAVYLLINLAYAGAALPVSGTEKSRFPMPYLDQLGYAITLLRAPLVPMEPALVYRILPTVLCPIWALGYVAVVTRVQVGRRGVSWSLRSFATRLDAFLVKMAPGVVLLAIYDLIYVFGVGHWYFPVSTLYVSLTSLSLLRAIGRSFGFSSARAWAGVAVLGPMALLLFWRFQHKPDYHRKFAEFYWETAPRVRRELGAKLPKLVEMDDGIVAYSLGVPSVSGFGYVLDAEAQRAKRAGRLFDVAYHRGFRAVSTFYYARHGKLERAGKQAALDWAGSLLGEDLSSYTASVLYEDRTFTIVGLTKQGT
jgi:hypothetical protein